MKSALLFLCLMSFAPFVIHAQKYKHKSEAEIAQMTPGQRVDQYADEQAYHKYDVLDEHSELIAKYTRLDGTKSFPRTIEIIDEYDPTRSSGKSGRKGERFDGAWMLLGRLDDFVVRARASEEGRRAIDSLERAIERMRKAGYGQPDQFDWERHGRIGVAEITLRHLKGLNSTDAAAKDTFQLEYKIILSDAEMLELSNFMTANYPEYPGWSKKIYFRDFTRFNYAGNPFWISTLREPKRFYEAFLEFEKIKNNRK